MAEEFVVANAAFSIWTWYHLSIGQAHTCRVNLLHDMYKIK